MADKLVKIAEFADNIEADLAKQLLGDYGIRCVLTGQNFASVYPIPSIAEVSLHVFENQAQRAMEILESNKKQEQ